MVNTKYALIDSILAYNAYNSTNIESISKYPKFYNRVLRPQTLWHYQG